MSLYVFIDASNIWQAQKSKGKMLNYEKLKAYFVTTYKSQTIKIFYYTAYPKEGTREYDQDNKHKFFTYLKKGLGFEVRKKELKRITVHGADGDFVQEKGNMDVEMTIDIVHHASEYTTALFLTGDSDFLPLIRYLKNKQKRVYVYSTKNNVSHELRTGSDGYIDLLRIPEDIWGRTLDFKESHRGKDKVLKQK
jgi:uncharacterized LabA/DUF88 family protein